MTNIREAISGLNRARKISSYTMITTGISMGDEYERNPWDTSHSKEPGYRGVDPYLMDDGNLLRRELEEFNPEEALLKKQMVADDLRRQVTEKRKSICCTQR